MTWYVLSLMLAPDPRLVRKLSQWASSLNQSAAKGVLSSSSRLPVRKRVSRIQALTSKITQVCQDIRDIKLRRLLITRSDSEPNDITTSILTNRNDRKNTWGSGRSRPDPPDTHEDHAEGGNDYVYKTPNPLEHDIPNNLEDHGKCPPQPRPTPSGMTPEPLPYCQGHSTLSSQRV